MAIKVSATMLGFMLMLGALAVPASAQISTGTVSGTVKDAQGGVLPGATVTLVSEARGTRSAPVITNERGDFVFVNMAADTYTVEVTLASFKSLKRSGIAVSPGSRVAVGTLTLDIGGASETVEVKGEAPQIQASSGERSFTISTDAVTNLPIATRNFADLINLTPGVVNGNRAGDSASTGGGANNFMMDGVSTMEPGSNRLMMAVNVESIAEVKVLTSSYQAEYGRSSGLQVTAVTKSGSNRFHGSTYDVERNSDWGANSRVNILNGDPKSTSKQRDWGYSIGGPAGKPGGANKLFFFYAQEFQPRTNGNDVVRFKVPTALERAGDFSQTVDNNGNPFPYIRDPQLAGTCSATNQSGCFADGGVLGRIPANRLYPIGQNILNLYPLPNIANVPPGQAYNYELTRPVQTITSRQPVVRLDYQPMATLRGTFKYASWSQPKTTVLGSIPGFNDTQMNHPSVPLWSASVNYTLTPSTFLEGTVGHTSHRQAGCGLNGNGANFCNAGFPMNSVASRAATGLDGLPYLFPDANIIDPSFYEFEALNQVDTPIWNGTRVLLPPTFQWGSRVGNSTNTPPTLAYPGFADHSSINDFSGSITKVLGHHTLKAGYYQQRAIKQQNQGNPFGTLNFGNDTNNPLDAQFGYANAVLGIFSSYAQSSKFVEGQYVYNNNEAYLQDNWKVTSRLTFDYGVRFVHQQPQYDYTGQSSNFLPDKYAISSAPLLYAAGCVNGGAPCSGANRQAVNPATGQFLGVNSTVAIGAIVPDTGSSTNGLFQSGQGIVNTTYKWPPLALGPRFGMAYDLTGSQKIVVRGAAGLFYDRPSGNAVFAQVLNPPNLQNVTVRNGQLQTFGNGGLALITPPALSVFEYDGGLPSSVQWNGGVQMALPWSVTLDVAYVGQHQYNILQNVNLNAVDFGAAFLPQNQDPTLAASATPGATAVPTDQMRAIKGYSSITQTSPYMWRTYHSLQWSVQRRFRNGVSFGFNDVMGLYDHQNVTPRLQHAADGSFSVRADQAEADALLGNNEPQSHIMKANFIWDLPDIPASGAALRTVGLIVNDWQLAGIWTGTTGTAYTIGYSYQNGGSNVNLTGSPDYGGRIRIVGDPGGGCSSDVYRQFNTSAFQGPLVNSVGLESGTGYVQGCFSSIFDLSILRTIRLGGGRTIQLRADMFNAPNQAGITGRNTSLTLTTPNDPVTAQNLPFDASGNLIAARSRPRGAGFGVANNYQAPRSVQAQIRFGF
jgi:carboxypeptidase family protein